MITCIARRCKDLLALLLIPCLLAGTDVSGFAFLVRSSTVCLSTRNTQSETRNGTFVSEGFDSASSATQEAALAAPSTQFLAWVFRDPAPKLLMIELAALALRAWSVHNGHPVHLPVWLGRGFASLAMAYPVSNTAMTDAMKSRVRDIRRTVYDTLTEIHRYQRTAVRREYGETVALLMIRGSGLTESVEGWLEHAHFSARSRPYFDVGLNIQPHLGWVFSEAPNISEEFILIGKKTKTYGWLLPEIMKMVKRYRLTREWLGGRFKPPAPEYVLGQAVTPGAEALFVLKHMEVWGKDGLWTDSDSGITYRRLDLFPSWRLRRPPPSPSSEASSILEAWSKMSQKGGHQILVGPEPWRRFPVLRNFLDFLPPVLAGRFIIVKDMSEVGRLRPKGWRNFFYGTNAEFQIMRTRFPNVERRPMAHLARTRFHELLNILWRCMPTTTKIASSDLGGPPHQEYLVNLLDRSRLWKPRHELPAEILKGTGKNIHRALIPLLIPAGLLWQAMTGGSPAPGLPPQRVEAAA